MIDRPTVSISTKRMGCNTYELNSNVDTGYNSVIESNWEVLDANYKPITDTDSG